MNKSQLGNTTKGFIYTFYNGKQVIVSNYKEKCFIAVSSTFKKDDYGMDKIEPIVSYIYYDGYNTTVEWEPKYGPISVNTRCKEDGDSVRDDFFLGFATNDWTQLAVDELNIKQLSCNDIDYVFTLLSRYAS